MKLADLRGASAPVATYDYAQVLGEVMETGHEGVTFRDPGELANLLVGVATSLDDGIRLVEDRAPGSRSIRPSAGTRSGKRPAPGAIHGERLTDRSSWRATPEWPPPRRRQSATPWPASVSGSRGPTSNN